MRMLGIGGVSYGTLLFLALIQRSAWKGNSQKSVRGSRYQSNSREPLLGHGVYATT
jgi:hypothetical protein